MNWWLHATIYVLGILAIFFAVGALLAFRYEGLVPFAIFILPIPAIAFHIAWKRVRVPCTRAGCGGAMEMSAAGSLYYRCTVCGEEQRTIVRRHPHDRG